MINSKHRFVFILIGSFFSQIVQVGLFPLFLAQKLDNIGVPLSIIGWILSVQWVSVFIFAPLVLSLSRIVGLSNVNKTSGILTLMGLLCLIVDNLTFSILASILTGAGLILRWVACDTLIVKLGNTKNVGRLIGTHETLMGFGIAIGPLLFVFLVLDQIFYVAIIIIVVSSLVFFLNITSPQIVENKKNTSLRKTDFFILKIAFLMALLGGFIETASVALFPFYFAFDGFSINQSAWFISAFGLGGTLLQLPIGFLVDKIGYRYSQLCACFAGLLTILGLFVISPTFITNYIILFVFGGAVGAFNTLAVIQAGSQVSNNKSVSAMTYIAMSYTTGSILSPIITANVLNDFNGDILLLMYAMIITICLFIIAKNKNL